MFREKDIIESIREAIKSGAEVIDHDVDGSYTWLENSNSCIWKVVVSQLLTSDYLYLVGRLYIQLRILNHSQTDVYSNNMNVHALI